MTSAPRLIIISVDALSPGDYLNSHSLSSIRRLTRAGAFAERMLPVFPTVTFTNHASIVTGVHSDRHGIGANTRFDPERVAHWRGGESQDWYFESRHLRAETLWDRAEAAGIRTALLRWPVTEGAKAHWLIPEVFPIGDRDGQELWDLLARTSTRSLIHLIERLPGFSPPSSHAEVDRLLCEAVRALLRNSAPELVLLHLTSYDHEMHEHGSRSQEARAALGEIDRSLTALLDSVDLSRTTVMVLGDHGFMDFTKRVHINTLFVEQGWIRAASPDPSGDPPACPRIESWDAIAHTNCAQAGVYLNGARSVPGFAEKVLSVLRRHEGQGYRILSREELDRQQAHPGALCAVECLPGFSLGQKLFGPLHEDIGRTRGEHGYRPHFPEIMAGFIAAGPGIPASLNLGEIRIIDVAPTAARILGIEMPEVEGRAIELRGGLARGRTESA